MPSAHARLSASASARWLNCPASVKACERYTIPLKGNFAAEEGTCAHELGELALTTGNPPSFYLGKKLNDAPDIEVTQEMVTYIEGYVEYVKDVQGFGDLFVEERVDYSSYIDVEGQFGTSDTIIINDNAMHIIDLKFGRGEVLAIDNTQMRLYALGALNEYGFLYDIDEVHMHIYQPRIGNISVWEQTIPQLLEFAAYAKKQADIAVNGDGTQFNPGEKQCQWCDHKTKCVALKHHTESVIMSQFDDLDLPPIETVDVANVLKNKSLIESWLKAIEEEAKDLLLSGGHIDGYKVVAGRSARKWVDDDDIIPTLEKELGDDAYSRKLLSPSQAEKLLGKEKYKALEDHVEKVQGKNTIAPISDRRKAINVDASCEFESL